MLLLSGCSIDYDKPTHIGNIIGLTFLFGPAVFWAAVVLVLDILDPSPAGLRNTRRLKRWLRESGLEAELRDRGMKLVVRVGGESLFAPGGWIYTEWRTDRKPFVNELLVTRWRPPDHRGAAWSVLGEVQGRVLCVYQSHQMLREMSARDDLLSLLSAHVSELELLRVSPTGGACIQLASSPGGADELRKTLEPMLTRVSEIESKILAMSRF